MASKKNLGQIGIGCIVFLTGLAASLYRLFCDSEPSKYSPQWFEKLSDDELDTEREVVRQQSCVADEVSFGHLQSLLYQFDDEIRSRNPVDTENFNYPPHREHGWHLQNDD